LIFVSLNKTNEGDVMNNIEPNNLNFNNNLYTFGIVNGQLQAQAQQVANNSVLDNLRETITNLSNIFNEAVDVTPHQERGRAYQQEIANRVSNLNEAQIAQLRAAINDLRAAILGGPPPLQLVRQNAVPEPPADPQVQVHEQLTEEERAYRDAIIHHQLGEPLPPLPGQPQPPAQVDQP
jgi:hypothetical protein